MPHLGPTGPDTGASVPFQLEDSLGYSGNNASRNSTKPAGGRVLSHLLRHISGDLLIVWDGLATRMPTSISQFLNSDFQFGNYQQT
jgi:hypothetical protein